LNTAILLSSCPDAKGVVARVTGFLHTYGANLVHADHHADLAQNTSFLRLEWELEGFSLDADSFRSAFSPIAQSMGMEWSLRFSSHRPKVGILVSKQDHCLVDLLHRFAIGELPGQVSFVAGNHRDAMPMVEHYGLPWMDLSARAGDEAAKAASENAVLERMRDDDVELVVLARYMQVLSGRFLSDSTAPVINIHHSFLPSVQGRQALSSGARPRRETDRRDGALRHRQPRRGTDHRTGGGARRPHRDARRSCRHRSRYRKCGVG